MTADAVSATFTAFHPDHDCWLMTVDFSKIRLRPLTLFPKNAFEQKLLARTSLLQYLTFQFFAVSVLLALPVKLFLRLVFTIKYVWVTPWFNI